MKPKRLTLKEVLSKEMQDAEFSFYYQHQKSISQIARLVKQARIKAGLTQKQLADHARTSQAVIARLESGADSRTPSLDLLARIARSLRGRLVVGFEF